MQEAARSRRKPVWPFIVGPVLALAGVLSGSLVKVGGLCGTYFGGKHLAAELYDTMARYGNEEATCIRSAQQTGIFVWVLIVLGVVVVIAGAIMRTTAARQTTVAGPADSAADQLAKLAALRDQGVLSESEFQSGKQKVLGGPTGTDTGVPPQL